MPVRGAVAGRGPASEVSVSGRAWEHQAGVHSAEPGQPRVEVHAALPVGSDPADFPARLARGRRSTKTRRPALQPSVPGHRRGTGGARRRLAQVAPGLWRTPTSPPTAVRATGFQGPNPFLHAGEEINVTSLLPRNCPSRPLHDSLPVRLVRP